MPMRHGTGNVDSRSECSDLMDRLCFRDPTRPHPAKPASRLDIEKVYNDERAHANDAETAAQNTTFVSKPGDPTQGPN
jgi:hypothetical protein